MRRFTMCFAAAMMLLYALAAQAGEGLTKIADNVYSYVDVKPMTPQNSYAANAGIVVGDNAVLAVDTLISAKEAKRFIADIRKITDKPIKFAVNTHYHLDHALGNCEFRKLGAAIISQELDAKSLAERGPAILAGGAAKYGLLEEDMKDTVLAAPDVTFTDRMSIDLGGIVVDLIYPGPSHTSGSIFVSIPARKVVFAGDALFTDVHPFLGEGDMAGWAKALNTLLQLNATAIIPGHGPVSTAKDVADMKEYLVIFDAKAKEIAAQTSDPQAAAAEILKTLPKKSQGEMLVAGNLAMKYMPQKPQQ